MVTTPKRIHIEGEIGTDLEAILDDANSGPVLVERDGKVYLVSLTPEASDEDLWAGYDPERAQQVLEEVAGSWADIDTDKLIEDIYRYREQGTRPPDRPRFP